MTWDFQSERKKSLLLVTVSGAFDIPRFRTLVKSIRCSEHRGSGMSLIMDLRKLDFEEATYPVMSQAAAIASECPGEGNFDRVALVIGDENGWGSSRQFLSIIGEERSSRVRMFSTMEAAAIWIDSPAP